MQKKKKMNVILLIDLRN